MEVILLLVGLPIAMALIPAYIAKSKGRSFGQFLFYGLMLGPIAIIHALVMKAEAATAQSEQASKKCPAMTWIASSPSLLFTVTVSVEVEVSPWPSETV
jgi:hypothetical protein